MTVTINGTSGVTFPDSSTQAVGFYGFKNRIINGGMVIQQRGNSPLTNTALSSTNYCLDRFTSESSIAGKFTTTQSSVAPAGFTNSALITSASAYSVGSGDFFTFEQRIEAYNMSDLGWGAAGAKAVTLSFWVQSSLTGTFGGAVTNHTLQYSYPFTYTISAASTWTQITITVPGPTAGTWNSASSSTGIIVAFGLGVGSTYNGTAGAWASSASGILSVTGAVSVVGTSSATWYVTGVQLEKGSTATSFDYRPYGTELMLCQRYYFQVGGISAGQRFGTGWQYNTTIALGVNIVMPVPLRDPANVSVSYSALSDFSIYTASTGNTPTVITVDGSGGQGIVPLSVTIAGTATAGYAAGVIATSGNARIKFSNEL